MAAAIVLLAIAVVIMGSQCENGCFVIAKRLGEIADALDAWRAKR
jgi:hypothetical protein